MICIILVAGHGKHLELQIKLWDGYTVLKTGYLFSEALHNLAIHHVKTARRQLFKEVFLVTNADKYKYFERWATANDFPVDNVINDGTTTFNSRLGSVGDFDLVLRNKKVEDDVMLVAGDMLFQDHKFDILQVVHYFKKKSGELAVYYEMEDTESCTSRGIVEVCQTTNRITRFYEKPKEGDTTSRLASVVFYCFRKESLPTIPQYLDNHLDINERNFGNYMQWLVNQSDIPVFGMKLPTGFQLIGQVTLADYEKWLTYFSDKRSSQKTLQPFTSKAYARIRLMGNPSDGFHGKTISLSIKNFWGEVTIIESRELVLVPHPLNDPTEFGSLGDLHGISRKEGYFGGLRLLQATCKKFYQYCSEQGIVLPKRNFTLKYDTNIPRQVGLAGSSAIVTATLRCLMHFFDITEMDMKRPLQPQFILDVEVEELFITAGLQDRVIQVYEGLVHMDFSEIFLKQFGHGCYSELDISLLPPLWLAYIRNPSDSGKIHSTVTDRWRNGDTEVIEGMLKFAELTEQARQALEGRDYNQLKELMDLNFDLRRKLYGDDVIGAENLQMVALARQFGSSAKFPGSGGAVIGFCSDQDKLSDLKRAFQMQGFVICDVIPNSPVERTRKGAHLS